jgi:predicted nucleic acid-binding protein
MSEHFLDSSALLKRYRQEAGSQWMLDLSRQSDRLLIARLAHIEITAAIVRRGRQSAESSQTVTTALAALESDLANELQIIEFSEPLIFRAIELAKARALRAADAIQLASALLARAELPPTTEFFLVSADDELNAAAAAEGLQVENPNLHP